MSFVICSSDPIGLNCTGQMNTTGSCWQHLVHAVTDAVAHTSTLLCFTPVPSRTRCSYRESAHQSAQGDYSQTGRSSGLAPTDPCRPFRLSRELVPRSWPYLPSEASPDSADFPEAGRPALVASRCQATSRCPHHRVQSDSSPSRRCAHPMSGSAPRNIRWHPKSSQCTRSRFDRARSLPSKLSAARERRAWQPKTLPTIFAQQASPPLKPAKCPRLPRLFRSLTVRYTDRRPYGNKSAKRRRDAAGISRRGRRRSTAARYPSAFSMSAFCCSSCR
jgi:hypothetical protein